MYGHFAMLITKIIFTSKLIIGVLSGTNTLTKTSSTQLKIHVGTWNVDAKGPSDDVDELIGLKNGKYDLILLGLQELVSPSLKGAVKKLTVGEKWSKPLDDMFEKKCYTKVQARTMFGIGNYVYVLASHNSSVKPSSIKVEEVMVGILNNKVANKGGIIISFDLYGKGFTVISSHLPAHYQYNEKRINAYHRIFNKTIEQKLKDDFMFWYGDLNFRVDENDTVIREAIKDDSYKSLLERDQLKMSQINNSAFVGWSEANIEFKPTFKYETQDDYSTERRPSWTDRILYKSKTGKSVTSLHYKRLEYKRSDHRPVIADFTVTV